MKTKSVITLRVPIELKSRIEKCAATQGVSINQFALYTLTKGLGDIETGNYFNEYLKNKKSDDILDGVDEVMKKVQSRKVPAWDRIDNP